MYLVKNEFTNSFTNHIIKFILPIIYFLSIFAKRTCKFLICTYKVFSSINAKNAFVVIKIKSLGLNINVLI